MSWRKIDFIFIGILFNASIIGLIFLEFDYLKESLFIENFITENSKENKNGQYFSFMNNDQLKETFDKVFL